MAQELKYVIRPQLDQGSVKTVRDQLNALEQTAKQTGTGSGSGTGDKPTKETKELSLALDALTKRYLENADALLQLRLQTDGYKAQLSEIQKVKQANNGLTDEQREQEEALRVALKDTNADLAVKTREMITLQQQNEATGNSYFEMEKRMRALSIQIKSLDTDTHKDEIATLTTEYNGLNTKLKQIDATMGNNQRNVGDYENSIRSAANALAIFQGPLGPLAGRLNSVATVMSRLSKANKGNAKSFEEMGFWSKLWSVITLRGVIPTMQKSAGATIGKTIAIKSLNAGIIILNGTLRILRTALKTTGILAVVMAITSLYAWFKRTEEGAEALRVRMAGVGAIFNVLGDRASALGKIIFEAFDDPQQAVKDLWEVIKTNLLNRIKGVGETFKALGRVISASLRLDAEAAKQAGLDLANAWLQTLTGVEDVVGKTGELVDEMRENSALAKELEERMNAVLRTERALGVERAEQNRDLQKARDLARDLSASFEERLEALGEIRRSEVAMMEKEMALERERLEVLEEQVKMSDSDAKAKQKVADQQIVIADLERKHFERSMSLRRDETSIIRQQNDMLLREARRRIDNVTRETNLRIAEVQREMTKRGQIVEMAERRMTDFTATRIEEERLLREQYEQELRNLYNDRYDAEVHGAEAAARAKHEVRLREIELENNLLDAREQRNASRLAISLQTESILRQTALDDELAQLQRRNDQLAIIEAERRALEIEMAENAGMEIFELAKQLKAQEIGEEEAYEMARLNIRAKYAQRMAEIEQRSAKQVQANQREIIDATLALTRNALGAIFGEGKAVATAQAIIDTLAGMNAALRLPPPLNWINAAAVGAAGFANVRKIQQTTKNSTSASEPNMTPPSVSTGFGMVDLPGTGGSVLATQVAGMGGPRPTSTSTTIILDGEFDKEALAVKVRQGSNAISSRAISIGA
jgi:hypothetical protein